MAERKAFLLRLPADLYDSLQFWARDDLRSLNAQIEFVLRDALRRRGRSNEPPPGFDNVESPADTASPPPDE